MSKESIKRYTSNGHSFNALKVRAKERVKASTSPLTLTNARILEAQAIGYPSWNNMFNEPRDLARDEYFADAFTDKKSYQPLLENYLSAKNLEDTLDNYRQFLCAYWPVQSALLKKPGIQFHTKEIGTEGFVKEFTTRIHELGPEVLLPQNIPDYLLEPASRILSRWLKSPSTIQTGSNEWDSFKAVYDGVILLIGVKEAIKTGDATEFKVTSDEIAEYLNIYSIQLLIEEVRRKSRLPISMPTLASILDMDAKMEVKIPPDIAEVLSKLFD